MYLFSDNAANFYNLANANGTQISKEYKLQGTVGITRRWDVKTFLSTDHDTQSDKRDIPRFFSFLLFLVCH